ncbi:MAG TPA: hypothetical protein VI911_00840 [Patescibacteria group bacterium]|nr:hypothetical protein [Patescibacteria group bacterium]
MRHFIKSTILILFLCLLSISNTSYAADLTFAWAPNTETNLKGYKIYYGSATRSYTMGIDVGLPATKDGRVTYTVVGVPDGVTLYFAATAYDTDGFESDYSKEVVVATAQVDPVIEPPVLDGALDPNTILINYPDAQLLGGNLYVGTTDKDIVVSWPVVSGAISYTFRLYDINKKVYRIISTINTNVIIIKLPVTGLYRVDLKADNMVAWVSAPKLISGWVAGAGPIIIQ